jgi:hypothetical protein
MKFISRHAEFFEFYLIEGDEYLCPWTIRGVINIPLQFYVTHYLIYEGV